MADKSDFTKDEWTLLLKSPIIAGMAITSAEPSGLWGLLKESFAGGAALARPLPGHLDQLSRIRGVILRA